MNKYLLKNVFFFIFLIFSFNSYSMVNLPDMDYVEQIVGKNKLRELSIKVKNWADNLDERDEGAFAIGCFGLATAVASLVGLIVLDK